MLSLLTAFIYGNESGGDWPVHEHRVLRKQSTRHSDAGRCGVFITVPRWRNNAELEVKQAA